MTEWLHFHFSLSCIGEGNGSPLQCSCLENPRDWGAWWAAVYEVAQSLTRLKWLSSSSSSNDTTVESGDSKLKCSHDQRITHTLLAIAGSLSALLAVRRASFGKWIVSMFREPAEICVPRKDHKKHSATSLWTSAGGCGHPAWCVTRSRKDIQWICEKMRSITNHQGDANQSHSAVSLSLGRIAVIEKTRDSQCW